MLVAHLGLSRLPRCRYLCPTAPAPDDPKSSLDKSRALARLKILIRHLAPPDDQVMLLYLEDVDAASTGEITGLSAGAVATRIHRIKALLSRQFLEESPNG